MKTNIILLISLLVLLSQAGFAQVKSTINYTYDAKGQVKSVSENGITLTYFYDHGGNRITESQAMGTSEYSINKNKTLIISPNPATDEVLIEYFIQNTCEVRISVNSLIGQEVLGTNFTPKKEGKQVNKLNISRLPAGAYILVVSGNTFRYSEKLILN